MKKRLLLTLCSLILMLGLGSMGAMAADLKPVNDLKTDYANAIENCFTWYKQGNSQIFNSEFLKASSGNVGHTAGDWIAIPVGRYFYSDNWQGYLNALEDYVTTTYAEKNGKLDNAKSTEWHRIALAVAALDGDPTSFGTYQGKKINLLADGVYNCSFTPWSQGVNGAIWGLLALDCKNYEVPAGAKYDRGDLIDYIINAELTGGGFNLQEDDNIAADPDITGMALQALAPYYNDANYPEVKPAVDSALAVLSTLQNENGGYNSWGTENPESTVQVLTALCSLGIDPVNDQRFVKNGKTMLDGLKKFYNSTDGGFIHSFEDDPENETSFAGVTNGMATQQVAYGLIAYSRFVNGETSLYDYSDIPVHDSVNFSDVKRGSWYYISVYDLVSKGIINGKTATTYEPNGNITRGEFAKILATATLTEEQLNASYNGAAAFNDSNTWAKKYINWASDVGVVNGTGNGNYSPNAQITRQDMAVMIDRYAKNVQKKTLPEKNAAITFSDEAQIAGYAKDAVSAMQKAGIINGKGNNMFAPTENATRAEAAKMISYFLKLV